MAFHAEAASPGLAPRSADSRKRSERIHQLVPADARLSSEGTRNSRSKVASRCDFSSGGKCAFHKALARAFRAQDSLKTASRFRGGVLWSACRATRRVRPGGLGASFPQGGAVARSGKSGLLVTSDIQRPTRSIRPEAACSASRSGALIHQKMILQSLSWRHTSYQSSTSP